MRSRPNPLFRLLDHDYHETFTAYKPRTADFFDAISRKLPSGWSIQRSGIWFHCGSQNNNVPQQGWKIHVSATPASAGAILEQVTTVLFRRCDTDFKFALDMNTLSLMNSKNWSRGKSGKFITIYPQTTADFRQLIEELYQATRTFCGPYILSDHRYKDSRVVFFRYGGMRLHETLNVKGERTPMLIAPDGTEVPDERTPYPVVPAWENPPIPVEDPSQPDPPTCTMKQGRYEIEDVLDFSNAGGVYRALDTHTGRKVVIKEARPCVNATPDGYDAVESLKKEYRLLNVLKEAGIAPAPLELFQEWEHWFLVEEFVAGLSLAAHSAQHNVLLRTRPSQKDFEDWYERFRGICSGLARILKTLHDHGIVFADLSINNLIVADSDGELKIIDFEGATQAGVDRPSSLYTPGFVSEKRLKGASAGFDDDYYSAGAVLMACLFPVNALIHLNGQAKRTFIECINKDTRFPKPVTDMVLQLMGSEPENRPDSATMIEVIEHNPTLAPPAAQVRPKYEHEALLSSMVAHLEHSASYWRDDRLFPADPRVFTTNPLSLAYGAAGVGYSLKKVTGKSSPLIMDWILRHKISREDYAPGLYVGLSGIALGLLEMGALDDARKIFQLTFEHPLLHKDPGIFYGTAGWGMTCLRFFLESGDELYLKKAEAAGRALMQRVHVSPAGYSWEAASEAQLGFAHGASGIALFLLYLSFATHNFEFLEAGRKALEFDLSFAVTTQDGGSSWRQAVHGQSPVFPYWRYGSAGIGTAALRFAKVLDDPIYRAALEKIFIDTDRQYVVMPGKFLGQAGLADFALDMFEFTGSTRYLKSALRASESMERFRVERPQGTAFPGDMLSRLCCDYGTGSAGIALVFNRLAHGERNDFLLDCLLEQAGILDKPQRNRRSLSAALLAEDYSNHDSDSGDDRPPLISVA